MTEAKKNPREGTSAKTNKSDLAPRLLTAAVALPVLLYIIFAAPAWFGPLVVFATATSAWEYCNIVYGEKHKPGVWFVTVLAAALMATMYWRPDFVLAALSVCGLLVFLFFLFLYKNQRDASLQIGASITALIYGVVMFGTIGLLYRDAGPAGPLWLVMVLCIVWISDTGAYFTGRAIGKHKLYPAVSPNKSVEGAVGGFVCSIVAALGLNVAFGPMIEGSTLFSATLGLDWPELSTWQVLLVAVPANILAQCGDLAESLIKRAHDVKDSGTIIYGHGGMLDRIDALIFASPWVYICFSNFL